MSTSSSLFCEYCGAANEAEAHYCCFCGRPLDEADIKTTSSPSSTASHALPIDTLLKGHYRIIRPVGQGGMGTVYHAQDTGLNNRAVAIKELLVNDPTSQDSTETIEAFKREATLLANLQHANLPSVFEHFQENGHWYMAMTFIQGQTLEDYLEHTKHQKLPLHEVLEIGKQLSSVLSYLHNQYPPIIFRDVKPANIMRTPDGRIYLIDFGVARRFKTGQKKDTIPFGSLGYAAPEQFGKAQTTPRSDIYGLGATLYELLTGHEPASTPLKFPSIRSLEPSLPFKLVTLIAQMLDHDESKRPANMLIVEQKLQEIDGMPWQAAPSAAQKSTPVPSPSKLSRRLISVLCTLIATFILLIGGTIGGAIGTSIGKTDAATNYRADALATTTAAANATATAVQTLALPDPYKPAGTLALFDPLTQENQWQEFTDSDWGASCQFQNNAYQIRQTKTDRFYHCDEANDTVFQNFAIEVKMTIVAGDCGGFVLQESSDNSGKMYVFGVCSDTAYYFTRYQSFSASDATTLRSSASDKINEAGENTIGVVENHGTIDLYVNHQKIDQVFDDSYDMGQIGLIANSSDYATTVLYQDITIWSLP